MELHHTLYFDALDALAILGALAVAAVTLLPVFRRDDALRSEEWTRIRLSFLLPLFAPLAAGVFGGHLFAVARLIFHVGATVYPLLGLALVAIVVRRDVEHRGHRSAAIAFASLNLALPLLAGWMVFVEPYHLEVTETKVVTDQPAREPLRVVVLADVQTDHFGDYEDEVARRVARLDADLVVLPGDLLQVFPDRYAEELPGALAFLEKLEARHGVFIVEGDADARVYHYRRGGAEVLDNEIAELEIDGRTLALAGTELDYSAEEVARTVDALEDHPAELKLLLAHRPMVATVAPRERSEIDLVIAGHTHGGQISLPLFGPPVTLSEAPRHVAAGGLHELGGRPIYVSRGVGLERGEAPRVRLGARPEISLLLVR